MRFVLLVEGHTEHAVLTDFLKRWLDPQLAKPVGIQTVRHDGWQDLVKGARKKAQMYLAEPRRGKEVLAVIALLDLYGPTYPGGIQTMEEKLHWLRKQMDEDRAGRFLVYCAVHETEAWLLSQPSIFPKEISKHLEAKSKQPEMVNSEDPPAKLLDRLFKEKLKRGYQKVTDGNKLFPLLDPQVAAARCPQLRDLLKSMLDLAQATPGS